MGQLNAKLRKDITCNCSQFFVIFSFAINPWGQAIMKSFQQVDFDTERSASPFNDELSQASISSHGRTDESSKKWQANRLLNDKEKIQSTSSERQILTTFNGRFF